MQLMRILKPPWLQLQAPLNNYLPLQHQHQHHHQHPQSLSYYYPLRLSPSLLRCALTKQGHRFLTSIATTIPSGDPSATDRIINKFVTCSTKSVVLGTLYHLLSPQATSTHPQLCSLALPLYTKITKASWFSWNSKLVANVIALLYKQGQTEEAECLISQTVSTCSKERDLVSFYCNLIDSHVKLRSDHGFSLTYSRLKEIFSTSPSVYVRKRASESLVGGLCIMGLPHEAETLINEMRNRGIKPSLFEFRSMVEGYGRLGLFKEMLLSVVEMEKNGFELDTISSNMVISSYGMHNELSQMVVWVQKVKSLRVSFSIRTYNSVLNACPTVMSSLQDLKAIVASLEELLSILRGDEALLVKELVGSTVLDEVMRWDSMEMKVDFHGMHLGTSYLILLQWMQEVGWRLTSGKREIPAVVTLVCGLGKHSSVRGDSPVKALVREILLRTLSPLRIDRKNVGCFAAKGKAVKDWLLSCSTSTQTGTGTGTENDNSLKYPNGDVSGTGYNNC